MLCRMHRREGADARAEIDREGNTEVNQMKQTEWRETAQRMLEFIDKSPTCYQTVANLKEMLGQQGYMELAEREVWNLRPGHQYYVSRNDSSLIAFQIPEEEAQGYRIVASHSDSPSFKVKENAEVKVDGQYIKLNTEPYGGMILSTWLDRPLSLAGRIVLREGDRILTKSVNIDRDLCVIPNVAIHMNRDINKGMEYNTQVDMLPLFGQVCDGESKKETEDDSDSQWLMALLAQEAGVRKEDIMGHDLFLYVRDKGRILGAEGEYVLSSRLDDLQCVYTSFEAFRESRAECSINVCAVFDNEEVGSGTRQGADSTFLEDTLTRICGGLGYDREKQLRMIADSFLISADNAHAVHPNHPEKSDPTNRVYLNGGIVIKYHGSQKYTTDGISAARMKLLCERADVPCQTYANRSDIAGGSTLGNISTAHVSVASVDIGLPQLAMHSAAETAGVRDTLYAVKVFREFYGEDIVK